MCLAGLSVHSRPISLHPVGSLYIPSDLTGSNCPPLLQARLLAMKILHSLDADCDGFISEADVMTAMQGQQ